MHRLHVGFFLLYVLFVSGPLAESARAAEDWLSPDESQYFAMFGSKVLIGGKIQKQSPDFRNLAKLATVASQPLRGQLEIIAESDRQMNPTPEEQARSAQLNEFLSIPDNGMLTNTTDALKRNFFGMMFGKSAEDFTNNMRETIDGEISKQKLRQREALAELRAINEGYIKRREAARRRTLVAEANIIDQIVGRMKKVNSDNVVASVTTSKKELCLKLSVIDREVVDPVVQVYIQQKPIPTERFAMVNNQLVQAMETPPPMIDVFPVRTSLKPSEPALVYLGLSAELVPLIQSVKIRMLTSEGWLVRDQLPAQNRSARAGNAKESNR